MDDGFLKEKDAEVVSDIEERLERGDIFFQAGGRASRDMKRTQGAI